MPLHAEESILNELHDDVYASADESVTPPK